MSRPTKYLLLFLALALPGLIYVFLKSFGSNEFEVPALYQAGTMAAPAGCDGLYTVPYQVPDSTLKSLGCKAGLLSVIVFRAQTTRGVISRVRDEFSGSEISLVEVPDSLAARAGCSLVLPPLANVVVVDVERRIRGHYAAADLDEADRLILEIKIILKKY
jgi:hypothetical protein